jgi:hypothetical protein
MKRVSASIVLAFAFYGHAMAGVSPAYINYGDVTSPPVVDANSFVNLGIFDVSLINPSTNLLIGAGVIISGRPYSTRDTANWTNQNVMLSTPGFRFDKVSGTGRTSAANFFNSGSITGVDTPGQPYVLGPQNGGSATAAIPYPDFSVPFPSQLIVDATNIVNQGSMQVGSVGLLQMNGNNVNLANGTQLAGSVSESDPTDLTGSTVGLDFSYVGRGFIVDPPEVYDLYWGATNGDTLFLPWSPPIQPTSPIDGIRGYSFLGAPTLPFNFSGISATGLGTFQPFVYEYTVGSSTNVYINMMFINTNVVDENGVVNTNVTVAAGFDIFGATFPTDQFQANTGDPNGIEDIVEFSEPVVDVNTGLIVTNAVYLVDVGALLNPMTTNINTQYTTGYSRPNEFQIYTAAPLGLAGVSTFTSPGNTAYDPSIIYSAGNYVNNKVSATNSAYGVQIGRNPENVDGSFAVGSGVNSVLLGSGSFDLPDMTNEPARVEINAGYLNLTNSRFRAEGVVTINGSNVVGSPFASDWGNINASLTATNGMLMVSNIFPTTFKRIRGDIYAYGIDWMNTFTNGVTNVIHYHALIVDQNIHGSFRSSVRDLHLKATNISIMDPLRVINSDVITASNLSVNAAVTFTQNAGNQDSATNLPNLKNLLVNTNGGITVDSVLDVGYPQTLAQSTPAKRKYSVLSVTNYGTIAATAPLFQAASFENDGSITAAGGSMIVNAGTIGLSQAGVDTTVLSFSNTFVVGQTNFLLADGSVTLSAMSIVASNSVIEAGGVGATSLGSLNLEATQLLTDNTPATPGTNNVLVNYWQTTTGFSLNSKPANGDLFGTQIKSIVTGHNVANHVWAGADLGPTAAGFSNNVVIGRLVLDRQTTGAVMHFSGAGKQNGMYVDFLELDDASYSDYRNGLIIDPNLTIYFADSTADPIKLEQVYPGRLVWVPNFVGPNSTAIVPYVGGGFCLMNAALANSTDISTADDGIPNAFTTYPLNNPTNGDVIPCPSGITTIKAFAAQGTETPANFILSVYGQGNVTPEMKSGSPVKIGSSYTLSATPAPGWVFNGWTGTYPTRSATVKVTMVPGITNVNMTATFVPNPFHATAGSYSGLFTNSGPGGLNASNSGFFTMIAQASGVVSGRLQTGPNIYTFSGHLSGDGSAILQAKSGASSLAVNVQLDTTGQSDELTGTVAGTGWTASLQGFRAPVWSAAHPAPQQGHYTTLFSSDAAQSPAGDSYATVAVSASGNLSMAGSLADGAAISQSVPVSKGGYWPLYSYASSGLDTLLGWITVASDGSGFNGTVNWFKQPGARTYSSGFHLQESLSGDRYTPPTSSKTPALNLTNGVLVLANGGLAQNFTNSVALTGNIKYSAHDGSVTFSVNPATGAFNGSFIWPGTHRITSLGGVVLQSEGIAGGYFLGTNQSGSVLLRAN